MRKKWKHFVLFVKMITFAIANLGDVGLCALQPMLHDRLTDSLTLLNLGNSTNCVNHELVKASLVSSPKDTDCFTIFLTQGTSQNRTRRICEEACPSSVRRNFL
jgi:hypothetical protein